MTPTDQEVDMLPILPFSQCCSEPMPRSNMTKTSYGGNLKKLKLGHASSINMAALTKGKRGQPCKDSALT